jgi:hypothetical protein
LTPARTTSIVHLLMYLLICLLLLSLIIH